MVRLLIAWFRGIVEASAKRIWRRFFWPVFDSHLSKLLKNSQFKLFLQERIAMEDDPDSIPVAISF